MSAARLPHCLVLRLAGPLQSWGGLSQFNRRSTLRRPTKGAIVGMLAAAQGRRRVDPIEDLVQLRLGVRTDEPGRLLRDYHTVSDLHGRPMLKAEVDAKGRQRRTSPPKFTHVTERMYLQDAVFVAAIEGDASLLAGLREALLHPAFPLALGRRACVPTLPIVLDCARDDEPELSAPLWPGDLVSVLADVPWQLSLWRQALAGRLTDGGNAEAVDLPIVLDDPDGRDSAIDVPTTFDPKNRGFLSRPIRSATVRVPTSRVAAVPESIGSHDPFALLDGD